MSEPEKRAADTGDLLARGLAAAGPGGPGTGGTGAAGGTGRREAPSAESLAEVFPGLRVVALAGRGGMGVVYRAEQTRLGRAVAVKILPPVATPDPMARERFEREARVLSGLNHPNVLQIFDFGALADGTLYLVTEWADGGDLAGLLGGRAHGLAEVCGWVGQIASALDAAHARGVVHRDLKPANVLVRADGRLALADFGLAHTQGAGFTTALTLSGTIFGSFDYMAPEQMAPGAAVSPATDVYALGVMTYQMLTGRVPKGAFTKPSRLAGAPVVVDALIDAALANEAALRPGGAGEFARRLAVAAGGRSESGAWGRGKGGEGGKRSHLPWIAGVGALAIAAAWWLFLASPRTRDDQAERGGVVAAQSSPPVAPDAPRRVAGVAAEAVEGWASLLAAVEPTRDAANGTWSRRGAELVSGGDVCALRLPVRVPENFNYDVAMEFTRTGGRNSVGVFLATSAGNGVFELDAWERGLGGLQMINGQEMRAHGEHFPASLRNGERQRVLLEVRGARVRALWNGEVRREWDLRGRRFTNNWMWEAGADMTLGLCSWRSPAVFHRVDFRAH